MLQYWNVAEFLLWLYSWIITLKKVKRKHLRAQSSIGHWFGKKMGSQCFPKPRGCNFETRLASQMADIHRFSFKLVVRRPMSILVTIENQKSHPRNHFSAVWRHFKAKMVCFWFEVQFPQEHSTKFIAELQLSYDVIEPVTYFSSDTASISSRENAILSSVHCVIRCECEIHVITWSKGKEDHIRTSRTLTPIII